MKLTKITNIIGLAAISLFSLNPALAATVSGASDTASAPHRAVLNDTFQNQQWYLDAIQAYEAWAIAPTSSAREVVVAVIDGGVDDSHPDLKGALWEDLDEPIDGKDNDGDGLIDDGNGWNYVTDSNTIRPVGQTDKDNGAWEHGTIVSSLIGARGNDNIGMAGMAWNVKIMPLVILGANGSGGTDKLANAIRYAIRHRADIINLSLEGDMLDPNVADAILEATSQGLLVVIAAGNGFDGVAHNFDDFEIFPACHPGAADQGVLVVTGIQESGAKFPSANYGSCVDLAAPGGDIFAARPTYDPDGNHTEVPGYGVYSGTSMSAPLVTGVAAMLKAAHPSLTGEQLAKRIVDTSTPFAPDIDSTGMGAGVLNAYNALKDFSPAKYGAWNLFASAEGGAPIVWITDDSGNTLFTIPVGAPQDKRAIHAAFIRWDDDRYPEVIVTASGDERGDWRVYRTHGVLLAAGRVSETTEAPVKGGALLASQDITNSGWDQVIFSEAKGNRFWIVSPDETKPKATTIADQDVMNGIVAVGLERPLQSFILLSRGKSVSNLYLLDKWNLSEGTQVETGHPENLKMVSALTADNRELLRFVQSGTPSYLMEKAGMLRIVEPDEAAAIKVFRWLQAPLGEAFTKMEGKLFYDTWPR